MLLNLFINLFFSVYNFLINKKNNINRFIAYINSLKLIIICV